MRPIIRPIALAVLGASLLAACGSDADEATDTTAVAAAASETVAPESGDTPSRIVSLSPSHTETLFAIGAGAQVVAVDSFSNFPAEAPITDLSAFEPNVEAVAGYEPDLVVLSDDMGGIAAALEQLEIPILLLPAAQNLDEVYAQIEQLGAATGKVGEAAELVKDMQTDIDEIVTSLPEQAEPLTYYHELDNTYYSVTSTTFVGQLYSLLGLENIADAADDGTAGGYPQLSAEYIVEQDPDLVFLADTKCCGQTAATVAARPGWDVLTAVTNGGVVEFDDDIASRWGPRIVDQLRTVADAIAKLPVG